MYENLKAEMVRSNVSKKDLATLLSVRYATILEKISGKYPFKLDEAMKIKRSFFPDMSLEYLFDSYDLQADCICKKGA
jgi:plasmid maintenance system antidote protein VapI